MISWVWCICWLSCWLTWLSWRRLEWGKILCQPTCCLISMMHSVMHFIWVFDSYILALFQYIHLQQCEFLFVLTFYGWWYVHRGSGWKEKVLNEMKGRMVYHHNAVLHTIYGWRAPLDFICQLQLCHGFGKYPSHFLLLLTFTFTLSFSIHFHTFFF